MKPIDEPSAEKQTKPRSKMIKTVELGKKRKLKPSDKKRKTHDEQLAKHAAPRKKKKPIERLKRIFSNHVVASAETQTKTENYQLNLPLVLANLTAAAQHTTSRPQTKTNHVVSATKNAAPKLKGANPQPQAQWTTTSTLAIALRVPRNSMIPTAATNIQPRG